MRAIIFSGPRDVRVVETKIPPMNSENVMVKTKASSISPGTEKAVLKGESSLLTAEAQLRWGKISYPLIPGYTAVGEIIKVGHRVTDFKVGERVYVGSTLGPYDGICSLWGGHVEYAIAPAADINRIPENVSYEEATFLGIINPALNGIIAGDVRLGDVVVIIGQGLVGLFTTQCALCAGAKQVIVTDIADARLKKARELGAHYTLNSKKEDIVEKIFELTNCVGADIVIDCAGDPEELRKGFKVAREFGTIDIVATYWRSEPPKKVEIFPYFDSMSVKQLKIEIAGVNPTRFRTDLPPTFSPYNRWQYKWVKDLALTLISDGRIRVKPLITRQIPVDDAAKAYKLIEEDPGTLGVVLKWE